MNAAEEILGPPLAAGLGDAPALVAGARTLSYAELARLVDRCGHALRELGLGRGERLLLLMDDTPELVAAWLAAVKIGAVAVALNVRATAADLRHMIADSAARAMIADTQFLPLAEEAARGLAAPPVLVASGADAAGRPRLEALLEAADGTLDYAPMAAEDMAFWLYTSGTTGRPKGVVHLHKDVTVADRHLKENLGVRPGDRVFTTSKLFFAFALGHSLLGGLRSGATVILYRGWPDAESVIAEVERTQPDLVFSVPSFYAKLLAAGAGERPAFRGVRHYVSAGERLPEALGARWREATGQPILEGIGTSETVFLFIANTPRAHRPGATGRALPWVEVRLTDDDGAAIRRPGMPGTLWVRMPSLFARYWKQPERTHAAFRDGFYRTGDVFSFDADGFWYHHGRSDDMLKISGQWVSPAEIEECVLSVPEVAEAAVVGWPNAEGLTRAALFVVAAPGAPGAALEERIRATLTGRLSVYKCPRTIRFVDTIPRTATGKVQRYRLRELLNRS